MSRHAGAVLGQLDRLLNRGTVSGLSEGQLLERFVAGRDEAAFSALVARHGPMVLGVCRRVLRDQHDVEDAFQATFLILVRRAGAIRDGDLVGHWLHGVAHRVAVRARAHAARRYVRERPGAEAVLAEPGSSPDDAQRRELGEVLDEELARLPESLRAPLVLCYLEGLTHEEAAGRLRWPVGTVRSRMARGRDLLRRRLSRRGLVASALALTTALAPEPVPAALLDATVGASLRFAAHGAAPAVVVSATAAALARGVLQAMMISKLKMVGAATLACVLALGGMRTFGQFGGVGGGVSKPAEAASPPGDRQDALIRSVERIQADLAESTRWNAALQRELQDLRKELESLRQSSRDEAPGKDARQSADPFAKRKDGREARRKSAPAGGGMMEGMGMGSGMMAGPRGMAGGFGGGMGGMGGRMGGMGGMGGMMGGMPGMMGGMGMGMGGGHVPDPHRLRYISAGKLIVLTSPEGDKVTAYSTETGKAKSLRLSESKDGKQQAIPIVSQGLVAFQLAGPKITRLAAFNVVDGAWYPQDLREPVEEATPIVSNSMVAYGLDRRLYAFSGTAKRWDVLELPEGVTAAPTVGNDAITFENDGHLYVFSVNTGKWEDIDSRALLDTPENRTGEKPEK